MTKAELEALLDEREARLVKSLREVQSKQPAGEDANGDGAVSLSIAALIAAAEGMMKAKTAKGEKLAARLGELVDAKAKEAGGDRNAILNAIGEAAGVSESAVGQVLRGEIVRPPDTALAGFAKVLGVALDELVKLAEADEMAAKAADGAKLDPAKPADVQQARDLVALHLLDRLGALAKALDSAAVVLSGHRGRLDAIEGKPAATSKALPVEGAPAKSSDKGPDWGSPVFGLGCQGGRSRGRR